MNRESEAFEREGAELVVVGNGAPNFIEGFRERAGYSGRIYTDPELRSHKALELRRDVRSTLSIRTLGRAVSAFRGGNRQTSVQGDAMQQGGVFVLSTDGELVYSYRSEFAGDHPSIADLVKAARVASQASGTTGRTTAN